MPAFTVTASLLGLDAIEVRVEAEIFGALRKFTVVGLPDSALRESRERVRCAIENSGFSFPHHEVIVSLSPAALPKAGAGFDLAIAICVLAADGQIDSGRLAATMLCGELTLGGKLCATTGVVAMAQLATSTGRELLVAPENAPQAALVPRARIRVVRNLNEAVLFLNGQHEIPLYQAEGPPASADTGRTNLGDVVGQHAAKRALEIAAAGGHNILLVGPPGTGKSMLAKRLISLLPALTPEESLEIAKIYTAIASTSLRLTVNPHAAIERPFRAPHHTTSTVGLIGGGSNLLPGDVSLAHHGVLFLDELPEFRRDAIEALREPLESGEVAITRARFRARLPANFVLIAAMNPCPCGKRGIAPGSCSCPLGAIERYQSKVSGPIVDRIDLHVWVPQLSVAELHQQHHQDDPTEQLRARVLAARARQRQRLTGETRLNSQLERHELNSCCALDASAMKLLETAAERFHLSARAYVRVLRVARTIADLASSTNVEATHIAEALSYRDAGNESGKPMMQRSRPSLTATIGRSV